MENDLKLRGMSYVDLCRAMECRGEYQWYEDGNIYLCKGYDSKISFMGVLRCRQDWSWVIVAITGEEANMYQEHLVTALDILKRSTDAVTLNHEDQSVKPFDIGEDGARDSLEYLSHTREIKMNYFAQSKRPDASKPEQERVKDFENRVGIGAVIIEGPEIRAVVNELQRLRQQVADLQNKVGGK